MFFAYGDRFFGEIFLLLVDSCFESIQYIAIVNCFKSNYSKQT